MLIVRHDVLLGVEVYARSPVLSVSCFEFGVSGLSARCFVLRTACFGSRVLCFGFEIKKSSLGCSGDGFCVSGLRCRVSGRAGTCDRRRSTGAPARCYPAFGVKAYGSGFRISGSGSQLPGFGFRVERGARN